ncbi:tyrosine-type recombinase/integrase [Pseudobythopirellula maris]|uniref:tyrosine-type recombinase/integrase n=1 Tax=Pseudobythopirellula maris TaxID=2527991 RepID=UPI0037038A54
MAADLCTGPLWRPACPSEVLALRWADVLWDKSRLVVTCVKTEHHDGLGTRIVPLFPELEPVLAEAFEAAQTGAEYVITRTRDNASNLRTRFGKIVARAGLTPWPKLFQNLRATRATELADEFPGHVAAAWLGHSVKVAKGHYWQVTDDHFEAATSKSAANALQSLPASGCTGLKPDQDSPGKAVLSDLMQLLASEGVGDRGLEPLTPAV